MHRIVLVLGLAIAGCNDAPPPVSDARGIDAALGNTFAVPIGAACSAMPAQLCASGSGACVDGVCRGWCGDPPTCPSGTMRHDTMIDGANACVCVPAP